MMWQVGNLANFTESRSHFSMWAVMSSPLILSFDLTDEAKMAAMWPIITNQRVIAVNQRWAGHPGRRVAAADYPPPSGANPPPSTPASAVGWEWQVWAKPLGRRSHAVLFVATGSAPASVLTIPFANISSADLAAAPAVCVYDLYDGSAPPLGPIDPSAHELSTGTLGAHDSAFFCVSALDERPPNCDAAASRGACPV